MEHHWYERHVLPWLVDLACGVPVVRRQRQKVVPLARGRVLEVGIGTGLNLAHTTRRACRRSSASTPAWNCTRWRAGGAASPGSS